MISLGCGACVRVCVASAYAGVTIAASFFAWVILVRGFAGIAKTCLIET